MELNDIGPQDRVLMVISKAAESGAHLTYSEIAKATGMKSKSQAHNAVAYLEARGLVFVRRGVKRGIYPLTGINAAGVAAVVSAWELSEIEPLAAMKIIQAMIGRK